MPENTLYIGRGSKWGNPFRVEAMPSGGFAVKTSEPKLFGILTDLCHVNYPTKSEAAKDAVKCFERMVELDSEYLQNIATLKGKSLACFCDLESPCHGDELLIWANK